MDVYVMHFNEIDSTSLPDVGGKGANLGEMIKAGFPVPQGFCVTHPLTGISLQQIVRWMSF